MTFSRDPDFVAAPSEFDWISDERELARAGVKDEAGLGSRVIDALCRVLDGHGEQ